MYNNLLTGGFLLVYIMRTSVEGLKTGEVFTTARTQDGTPIRIRNAQGRSILNPDLAQKHKRKYKGVLKARSEAGMVDDLFSTRAKGQRLIVFERVQDEKTGEVTLTGALIPNPSAREEYQSNPDVYWSDLRRAIDALLAPTRVSPPPYRLEANDTLVPVVYPYILYPTTAFSSNGVAKTKDQKVIAQSLHTPNLVPEKSTA